VGERHPAPAAAIANPAVFSELVSPPQPEDHASRLKEGDVRVVSHLVPSERAVKALARALSLTLSVMRLTRCSIRTPRAPFLDPAGADGTAYTAVIA